MRKFSKVLSMVCATVFLLAAFTGCGSSTTADNKSTAVSVSEKKADDTSATEAAKPVTLRFSWWGGDSRHKATMDVITLYKTKNPNVTIEGEYMGSEGYKEKLLTQLASGAAPDIMQIDAPWMNDMVKNFKSFADLNQFKSLDSKGFNAKFVSNFGIIDGKLYGLPTGINAMALLMNKDVLAKANIQADQEWDWDKVLTDGQKVNKADKELFFMNLDQFAVNAFIVKPYIKQKTGKQLINDDYTVGFDKTTLADALSYVKKLFDAKALQPASASFMFKQKYDQNPVWVNKQVGAAIDWASTFVPRKAGFAASADVTLIPIAKDAKDTGLLVRPAQLLAINDKSQGKEEAAKFLNFFFNEKEALLILKDQRSVPPTEVGRKVCSEANLIDPIVSKAVDMALKKAGNADNALSGNIQIENIMIDTVEKVAYAQLTPDAAADEMIKQIEAKLKELKASAK